jgi:ABC-type oligopeptide transport system ATPase subunit
MSRITRPLKQRSVLLEVANLAKHYVDARGRTVHAVNDVSFTLDHGEVLGIVGESGCGKTTLGRCLMRLMEPSAGCIRIDGEDFLAKRGAALKVARRDIQMVFQDPFGSLNPRQSVGAIIGEPLQVHGIGNRPARVAELLDLVGLPQDAASRYPHEFSGGQRQRIAIARALALNPRLIIADEPVSALDVSIQSQILNLISDLRARLGLSMIFISHDLSVIKHVSDRIAVMHFGKIVEIGPTQDVLAAPQHAYTQALFAAIPNPPGRPIVPSQ